MSLTTAGPPAAGIYWQAAIYASFSVVAGSALTQRNIPEATMRLHATPRVGMLPPQKFGLFASASLGMTVGTEESTTFAIHVTSRTGFGQAQSTSFNLRVTASTGFGGAEITGVPPQRQVNVAVSRAATI